MYWRRSLVVTIVLLVVGYSMNSLAGWVLGLSYGLFNWSSSAMAQILVPFTYVVSGIGHFVVLWAAFSYYGPPGEKAKHTEVLRADDVLEMMDENELAILRERLMSSSK